MRIAVLAVAALTLAAPQAALAQDRERTLADIRQELSVLYVEVQKLKRELSTTGGVSTPTVGGSVLDRVAAMEAELQRLTAQTESLGNRVNRVVSDGTNRIGDLEFRLCELEAACDVSTLGDTSTLGGAQEGAALTAPAPEPTGTPSTEMAVGEESDFNAAKAAFDAGDFAGAVQKLTAFNTAYPGSPLAPEAEVMRGKALAQQGDTREAARAYLAGFSANPAGPRAPEALHLLGAALGTLGQTEQACITLAEVGARFPGQPAAASAQADMAKLGCS
jgi:tol-pal system protein YbgF